MTVNPVRRAAPKTNPYEVGAVIDKEFGEVYKRTRTSADVLYDLVVKCDFPDSILWATLFERDLRELKSRYKQAVPSGKVSRRYGQLMKELGSDISEFERFRREYGRLATGCKCVADG